MTDEHDEAAVSDAADLIEMIKSEFSDFDRPVTAGEFARLYGVMAAQFEANMAVFAVALEANPMLVFSDRAAKARTAMNTAVSAMTDALKDLATGSTPEDEIQKSEGHNGET